MMAKTPIVSSTVSNQLIANNSSLLQYSKKKEIEPNSNSYLQTTQNHEQYRYDVPNQQFDHHYVYPQQHEQSAYEHGMPSYDYYNEQYYNNGYNESYNYGVASDHNQLNSNPNEYYQHPNYYDSHIQQNYHGYNNEHQYQGQQYYNPVTPEQYMVSGNNNGNTINYNININKLVYSRDHQMGQEAFQDSKVGVSKKSQKRKANDEILLAKMSKNKKKLGKELNEYIYSMDIKVPAEVQFKSKNDENTKYLQDSCKPIAENDPYRYDFNSEFPKLEDSISGSGVCKEL